MCRPFTTELLVKLFAHKIVFKETPNLSAIEESVSPGSAAYSTIDFPSPTLLPAASPTKLPKTCPETITGGAIPTAVFSCIKAISGVAPNMFLTGSANKSCAETLPASALFKKEKSHTGRDFIVTPGKNRNIPEKITMEKTPK